MPGRAARKNSAPPAAMNELGRRVAVRCVITSRPFFSPHGRVALAVTQAHTFTVVADLAEFKTLLCEVRELLVRRDDRSTAELTADGAMSVADAAKFGGIARTELFELMESGELPYTMPEWKRLIPRRALVVLLAARMIGADGARGDLVVSASQSPAPSVCSVPP